MATYTTGTYKWSFGNFKINDKKFPIAVLEIDMGADLVQGDVITTSFFSAVKDGLLGAVSLCRIYGYTTKITSFYPTYAALPGGDNIIESYNGLNFIINKRVSSPYSTYEPRFNYNGTVYRCLFGNNTQADISAGVMYMIKDKRTGNYIYQASANNPFYVCGLKNYNPSIDPFGLTLINNKVYCGFIEASTTDYETRSMTSFDLNVSINTALSAILNEIIDLRISTDPYFVGGITEPGGGTGTFDGTSTPVTVPSVPTLSAVDTGFITLFNPTLTELNALATYMWSNPLFDLNAWKKIFADPMQAILGLSIVPVDVPAGTSKTVTVGNISTGISMTTAASQYVEVDCGSLNVEEFWGAYLDYAPYTKAEIYLPYIGTHAIQVDDIMGKTISCKYHVDILSGSCCAYLLCGDTVLYSFVGQCSSSIPITGDNWTNVINGALNIASAIGTMVATGGMSTPISAGSIAAATGRAIATDATLAGTAMTMKPEIERSGSMGGTGGLLGVQTPYLILTRPRQALPADQNKLLGYPSLITETLGDLEGWTVVQEIHLEGIACSSSELAEIETILKSGVIL